MDSGRIPPPHAASLHSASRHDTVRSNERREDVPRLITQDDATRTIEAALSYCAADGDVVIELMSYWRSSQRWARNRASLTGDRRDVLFRIRRSVRGGSATAETNQIDAASVAAATKRAESYAQAGADRRPLDMTLPPFERAAVGGPVWSDATFDRTPEENGTLTHRLTARAKAEGLLSAGYLESMGVNCTTYQRDEYGRISRWFGQLTQAQCSATVRSPKGTGSGWAGVSSYDFDRIDEAALANQAFEKCVASLDPVRIEPGRYTTILEPQAASTLVSLFIGALGRIGAEQGNGPFTMGGDQSLQRWLTKLGLKVVDDRVTITHDPADPVIGTVATPGVEPITLVDKGVLTTLFNKSWHAVNELVEATVSMGRASYRMQGGNTSMDEMIQSTKRGLIVTRLSDPVLVDGLSLLFTGVTRDGVWLVENGKITKAVRNFRWTESPLFILNNIDQIGEAVPIWNPNEHPRTILGYPQSAIASTVVPSLKVNDFSFTSTIDAI